jgi:hypothetical protein
VWGVRLGSQFVRHRVVDKRAGGVPGGIRFSFDVSGLYSAIPKVRQSLAGLAVIETARIVVLQFYETVIGFG